MNTKTYTKTHYLIWKLRKCKIRRDWKSHCSVSSVPGCPLCVCHTRWCECDTRLSRLPPRARWGSLHVEPLDITVSSVNWPLAPGHFTLGVNDVFTPLHNKQHTPRVHRLTKEIWLCFGCSDWKIRIWKTTLKLYNSYQWWSRFHFWRIILFYYNLGVIFCSFVYPSLSVMITLFSPKCGNTSLQQSDEQKTQLVDETTV